VGRRRRAALRRGGTAGTTSKLFLVFTVLVGINVYVFFFSPGSLQTISRAAQAASVKPSPPLPAPLPPAVARLTARTGTVREGEGLGSVLRREGVPARDVDRALRALRPLLDFRRQIHAGQKVHIHLTGAGDLAALEIRAAGTVHAVARAPDGRLLGARGKLATGKRSR
jgi:cell envelope opacity-associated protein A